MRRWVVAFTVALAALATGAADFRESLSARAPRAVAVDTTFSPAVIALGDSIFHGRVADGLCFACHGPKAKGTPGLAPDLTDAKWLNGDGSYPFIVQTVANGVPRPKERVAAPMPPKGGASLTPGQVQAVAAYVYSLRRAE